MGEYKRKRCKTLCDYLGNTKRCPRRADAYVRLGDLHPILSYLFSVVLHPGLKAKELPRQKRETEKMTLAKLGNAVATLFTDVDKFSVEYMTTAIPALCATIDDM